MSRAGAWFPDRIETMVDAPAVTINRATLASFMKLEFIQA